MTSHDTQRTYQAVLSLNNHAISLLERQAYQPSLEMFKFAIASMTTITTCFGQTNPNDSHQQNFIQGRMEEKLKRAKKMLASPELLQVNSTSPTVCLENGLVSREHRLLALGINNDGKELDLSLHKPRLIRIESAGQICPSKESVKLESTILVFNYAVARFYASKAHGDLEESKALLETALGLLNCILNTLSLSRLNANEGPDPMGRHLRCLLSIVIVKCVVRVLDELGRHSESQRHYARLVQLRTFILDLDQQWPFAGGEKYHAAPAA